MFFFFFSLLFVKPLQASYTTFHFSVHALSAVELLWDYHGWPCLGFSFNLSSYVLYLNCPVLRSYPTLYAI